MTKGDIIRMAREAGGGPTPPDFLIPVFERFAALVASAEREKVARWHIGSGYTTGHGDTIEDLLVELEWQVRESEREACAKVCDEREEIFQKYYTKGLPALCAEAIRVRGQA